MAFDFLKASKKQDGNPNEKSDAGKEKEAEREAANQEEDDGKKADRSADSNSKVECPNCGETMLSSYTEEYDEEGDAEVSLMDCLNCGFKYSRFEKFEKSKSIDDLNWGGAFTLLVLMLFTIILIKGEEQELFFNEDRPATNNRQERVRNSGEYPVLNDVEPFQVGRNN